VLSAPTRDLDATQCLPLAAPSPSAENYYSSIARKGARRPLAALAAHPRGLSAAADA
jgi:hypothetical protein